MSDRSESDPQAPAVGGPPLDLSGQGVEVRGLTHPRAVDGIGMDVTQAAQRTVVGSRDLQSLTRPLLEALARLSGLDSTYLVMFDWGRSQQKVLFVHSAAVPDVTEGLTLPLADGVYREALSGVTRAPAQSALSLPGGSVARHLGMAAYVSVPVVGPKHQLFGMLCGASRLPAGVSEDTVSIMEHLAEIISDHVTRTAEAAMAERAEAAEGLLRSRGMFLAEAEHQLKAPLAVLQGGAMTLAEDWSDMTDETRQSLTAMLVRSAEGLTDRVNHLLLEARADHRSRQLVPVPVDLGPFLRILVTTLEALSPSHSMVVDTGAEVVVWADPVALSQVVGHLLDNAMKYSPDGGAIKIRVTETGADVQMEFVDEGIGIPEAVDIFEPFRRGDRGVEETAGIGLGLYIVRNLVQAMGGWITARRNDDRGSTITVMLPAAAHWATLLPGTIDGGTP